MSLETSASNGNTTESVSGGTEESTVVGVTGQRWRANVSPWGSVTPWAQPDGAVERIDWHIAADDRWHTPATEAAVRQVRLAGAPVTETRVRIPDGDAVQRVWSVADRGGLTIIEIENDSPLPFAVALSGLPVLTERPPADMPLQGIELPAGAITLPIAHRTSIRVAIAHGPIPDAVDRHAANLRALPGADVVSRGWVTLAERASRLDLPDDGLADAVVAARCDLMLTGPINATQDPIGFILDVNELVRCGEEAEPWMYEIGEPLEVIARSGDAFVPAAIAAAHHIAVVAGDRRATKPSLDSPSASSRRLGPRPARSQKSSAVHLWAASSTKLSGDWPTGAICFRLGSQLAGSEPTSNSTAFLHRRRQRCHSLCAGTGSGLPSCGSRPARRNG